MKCPVHSKKQAAVWKWKHKRVPGKQSSALAKNYYKVYRILLWDVHYSVCWHYWFTFGSAQLQHYQSNLHIYIFFLAEVFILSSCLFDHVKALSSSLMLCSFTHVLNLENPGMFCCDLSMHSIRVKSSSVYPCTCEYAIFFLSSILNEGMIFKDAILSACLLLQISLIFLIVTQLSS